MAKSTFILTGRYYTYLIVFIIGIIILSSCKKDRHDELPVISFMHEAGFHFTDGTVAISELLKVGIQASGVSSAITNLVVTLETESGTETAVDSGIYMQNLVYMRQTSYGASKYEKWIFTVMDKDRNRNSISITFTRDPNSTFGPIKFFQSVSIGLQNNPDHGNFFSDSIGMIYKANSTLPLQQLISIIAYYGDQNSPPTEYTFSSPNETDAPKYYPVLNSYTAPKNEVRYKADSTSITPATFDATFNDSTIIANYTAATTGKRKFKSARAGYVIPFQIASGPETGKRGIIKVNSISGGTSGMINFDLKIQK